MARRAIDHGNSGNNAVNVLNNDMASLRKLGRYLTARSIPQLLFQRGLLCLHAFRWHDGNRTDLGALVGSLSSQANWISPNGLVVGLSENGEIDPLFPVVRNFVLSSGVIAR